MGAEIKFRFWDIKLNRFVKPFNLFLEGDGSLLKDVYASEYVIQQFTGIQSLQGQDIYVGDIAEREGQWDIIEQAIVDFVPPRFCALARNGHDLLRTLNYRIIGNILEHPNKLIIPIHE